MRPVSRANDDGETLAELLVAVVILAVAVVAIVGGLATGIAMSATHRKQAQAGVYLRAFASAIEGSIAAPSTGYVECASTYGGYSTGDPKFIAEVTDVDYWIFPPSSPGGPPPTSIGEFDPDRSDCLAAVDPQGRDSGVQRVTLQVSAAPGIVETLDIIIRRPCRTGDASCG